jgi:hypothetical protein
MRFARLAALASLTPLALFTLGCGDDPITPAQGAFSVLFGGSPPGTTTPCATPSHNMAIGSVTSTTKNDLAVNAQKDAEVQCSVTGGRNSFTVDVKRFFYNATSFNMLVQSISPDATEADPATGSITVSDANTVQAFSSSDCKFYFSEDVQGVDLGKAWLSFECANVTNGGGADKQECSLQGGTAIFEHCIGAPGTE